MFHPLKGLIKRYNDTLKSYSTNTGLATNIIRGISTDNTGKIWIANANCGVSVINKNTINHFTKKNGLISNNSTTIFCDHENKVWIGTTAGLNVWNGKDFVSFETTDGLTNNFITSIIEDELNNIWVGTSNGLNLFTPDKQLNKGYSITNYYTQDGLKSVSFIRNAVEKIGNDLYWGTSEGLINLSVNNKNQSEANIKIKITGIDLFDETINFAGLQDSIRRGKAFNLKNTELSLTKLKFDSLTEFFNYPKNLTLPFNINSITFRYATLSGNLPHKIKYRSKLLGYDEKWNSETSSNEVKYNNLPPGNYKFIVESKIGNRDWATNESYDFIIDPPFWERIWFRSIVLVLVFLIIRLIFKWRNKNLIERQVILEKTVEDRTKEIKEQKSLIEEKQREIIDSINYARRIQYALLATKEILDRNLGEYFIYFNPKDLVSGDFYWASELKNGDFVFATADSTGHGVPGAIMSILNIACLNESIKVNNLSSSADILNETRTKIKKHLANDGSIEGGKDGMDCSLIVINKLKNSITYSAANNPIWIIRNNSLITLAADRMPVGKHDKDDQPFTQNSFELQSGDTIYTFTDGFADQFGGEHGKKFKYKQLQNVLISISNLNLNDQKLELEKVFNYWKGDLEQVDDVCIIGFRL